MFPLLHIRRACTCFKFSLQEVFDSLSDSYIAHKTIINPAFELGLEHFNTKPDQFSVLLFSMWKIQTFLSDSKVWWYIL